jgi:hypothetical protein
VPRKIFWKDVRCPQEIRDQRLRKEIMDAIKIDIIYSPRGEEIQRERGHLGERRLFEWLDRRNISYMTERDLKKLKGQYTKTPDVLFMHPQIIGGKKVSWIESKANFGDVVEIRRNLRKQLIPYVKLFGHGYVVYWFGYVTDIAPPEGITLVDGAFFKEAGPPKTVHAPHHDHRHEGASGHASGSEKAHSPGPSEVEYFGE